MAVFENFSVFYNIILKYVFTVYYTSKKALNV